MQDTVRIYIKGAPEVVISNCKNHYKSDDSLSMNDEGSSYKKAEKIPMSEEDKIKILETEMKRMLEEPRRANTFSGAAESLHSMRAMAFSYCDMSTKQFTTLLSNV